MARGRRFYWLWGVAVPLLVGLVVYFLAANLTDPETDTMILKLGFAFGAAGATFYVAESYYLRREENQNKRRQDKPKDT